MHYNDCILANPTAIQGITMLDPETGRQRFYRAPELALMAKLCRHLKPGLTAVHICDRPELCINPSHLVERKPGAKVSRTRAGLKKPSQRGSGNSNCKLPESVIARIKQLLATGNFTQAQIARDITALTGVPISQQQVSDIKNGRTWGHMTDKDVKRILKRHSRKRIDDGWIAGN
jgi:predicted XRE-type DNA-binding protein